jgi:hypothetical protein
MFASHVCITCAEALGKKCCLLYLIWCLSKYLILLECFGMFFWRSIDLCITCQLSFSAEPFSQSNHVRTKNTYVDMCGFDKLNFQITFDHTVNVVKGFYCSFNLDQKV